MKRPVILLAAFALVLAGCSTTPDASPTASPPANTAAQADFLAAHDLDGMDGQQIVDHLDRMPVAERPTDLMASVRADQLVLADVEQEVMVPLAEDRFYLSVAPYVDQTHECYYHSLTTCRGELANEDIGVRIVDETGEVLVDEQATTFDNGFVGFWLPREVDGTIEVTYDGRTGQSPFSTREDGATCLTTLRIDA
ncbi:MAG: CueP family metal-binding protein [Brooklawnia sp.]|uniref:CueP family metal-binding protein n=1 Tax=Actinomycetes TaxID=1760 RepID=UPI000E5AC744|nr:MULTISPECIES: CueP family metal-binding protein [Actinomycetes]RGE18881.1 hypothetical protein D1J51_13710 [Leucobacter sp. wl10]WJG12392.1 CueP family metal-binding protein [Gordonia sp. Swx-4]